MFILYAVVIGLGIGLAAGGRLDSLSRVQFRWGWVFTLGLAVQLILFSEAVSERVGALGVPIYVGSTLLVALAVAANYRVPGMPIVMLGAASNLAAILANGGYMPASETALASLGRSVISGYSNSSIVAEPRLPWLTDIFALPAWVPATNVFSVGDVLIGLGVVAVIIAAMQQPVPQSVAA
jgi:Family of unknown function (DUF5317)